MDSTRLRNLALAASAAATAVCAGYDAWLWITSYLGDNFHNDFTFYYAAARLGMARGWSHLYDLGLQQQQLDAIGSGIRIAQLARYVTPPPLAWIVVPLTSIPYRPAYWLWSALLLAALVLAWRLSAIGDGGARWIVLAAAFGWLPVLYGLQLGQPALFVAAGVAASCALLKKNRDLAAGAVLAVIVLKPQLAVLVPAALLATGRWRAFAASAAALGVLAIASAIALGPDGVATYQARLSFATAVPENQAQTLVAWLHDITLARAVQAVIAGWTLLLAYRFRRHGPETVFAITIAGGLLASPYAHYDDLTMLGLAGLLYLRGPHPRWAWLYVIALVLAGEGFPLWGAGPVLAGELGALAVLTYLALRPQPGVPSPWRPSPSTNFRAPAAGSPEEITSNPPRYSASSASE